MSIRTIDPLLSEELASKSKTCIKSKVARYLTKDLIDMLAQPEPIKEYAEMKEKISKLKKKSMHSEISRLRIIEEQKIKNDVNPKLSNSSLNGKSYFDPLSFLNEHGMAISPSLSEHIKGEELSKPQETTTHSLNSSKSVFPFEKGQTVDRPIYKGKKPNTFNADGNLDKHEVQGKNFDGVKIKTFSQNESEKFDWEAGSKKNEDEQHGDFKKNRTEKSVGSKMRRANVKGPENVGFSADSKSERLELDKRKNKNGVEQFNGNKKTQRERSYDSKDRYRDDYKSQFERDNYKNGNDYRQRDKRGFQCESKNSRSGSSFSSNKNPNYRNDSRSFSNSSRNSKKQFRRKERNYKNNEFPDKLHENCKSISNHNFVGEKKNDKNFGTKTSYTENSFRYTEPRPRRSNGFCNTEKMNDSNNFINKSFSNSSEDFIDLKGKKITDDHKVENKVIEISPRKSVKFHEKPMNLIKIPHLLPDPEPRSKIYSNYLKATNSRSEFSDNNTPISKHYKNFEQDSNSDPELFSQESEFSFNPNSKSSQLCKIKALETIISQTIEENLKTNSPTPSKMKKSKLAEESYKNKQDLPLKRGLDKEEDFFEKKVKIGEGSERELDCSKVKKRWEDNKKETRDTCGKKDFFWSSDKRNDRKRRHSRSKRKSNQRRDSDVKRENTDLFGKEQRDWSKVDGCDGSDTRWTNESIGKANRYCIHN